MGIKRFIANADTTITNAYKYDLITRGTGSNTGLADSLETFVIYGQATTSSLELARILVNFSLATIETSRAAGTIPASGNVNFYLQLFNVKHSQTLPQNFTLTVAPVTAEWEEGTGKDLDEYTDLTKDGLGANWINSASGTAWATPGGDFDTTLTGSQLFTLGTEDLEVDVSDIVEQWLANTRSRYGLGVFFSGSHESGSGSWYTKKFSSRGSEFFHSRPRLEARWDSSIKDDRGNFYLSSSLASAADNTNTVYFYNRVRGQLQNIPNVGSGVLMVRLHDQVASSSAPYTKVTGGWVETGIYSASITSSLTASRLYDVWYSGSEDYHTGTIEPKSLLGQNNNPNPDYVINITNLKSEYSRDEDRRLRLYVRDKDWMPTIFVKATQAIETSPIIKAYYRVYRVTDGLDVVPYGTGATDHTRLSYDVSGNYFDLDMSMFEAGYSYGVKFLFNIDGRYEEQRESFKFRIAGDK